MSKRKKHGYVECLKYMHMNKEGRSIHSNHVEYGINNDRLHVLWNQYQLQGKAGLLKRKNKEDSEKKNTGNTSMP